MKTKERDRVRRNSPEKINEQIDLNIKDNIDAYSSEKKEIIDQRIKALDKEWDIERNIEVIAPSLILGGIFIGSFVNKKWLMLPVVVATFLLQHGIQGWCPPVAVLRWKKIRTKGEIDKEKYALKAIRGDFDGAVDHTNTENVLTAINKQ